MSDSLWPRELQHAKLPGLSLSPGVCSNSCVLSWWCYLTISTSATPFSSCPQSFPSSESFPVSWLFASGGQSIGASASAADIPMNQYQHQFSLSVISASLWPHELQFTRPPCPSPTPGLYLNSCSLSQWCHLTILCHPLLLLPSILPNITVFSNESAFRIRWPKYWSFSFNIRLSNEHPGMISFRMDWLNFRAVQGTLKSLFQHHSSKASTLQRSAFLIVQISNPYMTTGKTIALTRWTFVDKVMSLLLNMLSQLVITFLPRNKRLWISWLQWFWSPKK